MKIQKVLNRVNQILTEESISSDPAVILIIAILVSQFEPKIMKIMIKLYKQKTDF